MIAPDLHLVRDESTDHGVFGVLSFPGVDVEFEQQTVERPWRANRPGESCIPSGLYQLEPRRYFKGGYDAIEILDVPGRWPILLHIANWALDVEGCVGTGFSRLWMTRKGESAPTPAIGQSGAAHRQLMAAFHRLRRELDGARRPTIRIEWTEELGEVESDRA